jgi:hypothetical protein
MRRLAALSAVVLLVGACQRASHEILPPGSHVGYYVATDGTSGGDGSTDNPWDMPTALSGAGGAIQPGDTVWVRGGTYFAPFTSSLNGDASASIIVRAYPGERAIIDGKDVPSNGTEILTVDGSFTVFWGLEIINSATQRTDTRHSGEYLRNAQNVKLVNLIIHDTGMGVFGEPDARNCEVYGAIIYNGGWQTATRSNGHAMYMKGDAAGTKIIRNSIMFDMFGLGFHAYADAGTGPIDNITLEGNIIFNAGTLSDIYTSSNILFGGEDAADNITIHNNYTYFSPGLGSGGARLGYTSTTNGGFTFTGNYIVGGAPVIEVRFWNGGTVQGNVVAGAGTLVSFVDASAGYNWTNNTYYRDSTQAAWRFGSTAYSLPAWRTASGLGGGDKGIGASGTTSISVIPNSYEQGRANIVVYNWGNQTTAQISVGGILASGDHYEVRNVQALFGAPVVSGTYTGGGSISVPLDGVTPTPPIGGSPAGPVKTGPEFNAFLLLKTS